MKRTFTLLLAVLLCLALLPAAAMAEDGPYFALEDGYITGSYAGGFVEIVINDRGAGAGLGTASVKVDASEPGSYEIEVYDDGVAVYTQTIVVEGQEPEKYEFFVTAGEGGTLPAGLDAYLNGSYAAGTELSLAAREMPGYRFTGWISSNGGEFADASASQTTFIMPANATEVTALFEPDGTVEPEVIEVKLSADGKTAQASGNLEDVYARVAIVLDNNGQSGLYVTQAAINTEGTIVIPAFMVPGLTVKAVNIALVPSLADITSSTPKVLSSDFRMV